MDAASVRQTCALQQQGVLDVAPAPARALHEQKHTGELPGVVEVLSGTRATALTPEKVLLARRACFINQQVWQFPCFELHCWRGSCSRGDLNLPSLDVAGARVGASRAAKVHGIS